MFKHLIFDLDGTIIDTISSISEAMRLTINHFNLPYDTSLNRVKSFVGYGTPYLMSNICNHDEVNYEELINYFVSQQLKTHKKNAKIFPNLFDTLFELKKQGICLYVATNKPDVVAQEIIPLLYGKDFFKLIIGQKEGIKKKPDPESINIIIDKFKLKKEECLYVGDSEVDVLSGHNANIKTCLVLFGYGKYNEFDINKSDYVISKPEELKKIIK